MDNSGNSFNPEIEHVKEMLIFPPSHTIEYTTLLLAVITKFLFALRSNMANSLATTARHFTHVMTLRFVSDSVCNINTIVTNLLFSWAFANSHGFSMWSSFRHVSKEGRGTWLMRPDQIVSYSGHNFVRNWYRYLFSSSPWMADWTSSNTPAFLSSLYSV